VYVPLLILAGEGQCGALVVVVEREVADRSGGAGDVSGGAADEGDLVADGAADEGGGVDGDWCGWGPGGDVVGLVGRGEAGAGVRGGPARRGGAVGVGAGGVGVAEVDRAPIPMGITVRGGSVAGGAGSSVAVELRSTEKYGKVDSSKIT
jgi:hypothetical protein